MAVRVFFFFTSISNSQREFEKDQFSFLLIFVVYLCKKEGSLQNFSNFISSKLSCVLGPYSVMLLTDL